MTPTNRLIERRSEGKLATLQEAEAAIATFARECGFPYFGLSLLVKQAGATVSAVMLTNYPDDWRRVYFSRHYDAVDPVIAAAAERVRAFCWDELPRDDHIAARVFADAAPYGMHQGFTVPLHGPYGDGCVFSLAGMEPPDDPAARRALYAAVWSFCTDVYEDLRQIILSDSAPSKVLTKEQREVLTMVAEGLPVKSIADVLGLGMRAVEHRLIRACERLGVSCREQAIVVAVRTGEIRDLRITPATLSVRVTRG